MTSIALREISNSTARCMLKVSLANKMARSILVTYIERLVTTNMSDVIRTHITGELSLCMRVSLNQLMLVSTKQKLEAIRFSVFKAKETAILVQLGSLMTSMETGLMQTNAISNWVATGRIWYTKRRALLMRPNGSTADALMRLCPELSKTNLAMSRTNTSVKRWLMKRATTRLDFRTMVSAGLISHLSMINLELHKTAESWAPNTPTSCGLRLTKYLSTNTWAATRTTSRD